MRLKNWDYRELRARIADGLTLHQFTDLCGTAESADDANLLEVNGGGAIPRIENSSFGGSKLRHAATYHQQVVAVFATRYEHSLGPSEMPDVAGDRRTFAKTRGGLTKLDHRFHENCHNRRNSSRLLEFLYRPRVPRVEVGRSWQRGVEIRLIAAIDSIGPCWDACPKSLEQRISATSGMAARSGLKRSQSIGVQPLPQPGRNPPGKTRHAADGLTTVGLRTLSVTPSAATFLILIVAQFSP
jgi:hypothetical protein